tara:strand:- start:348 stop:893 length:546 start_codon:yes stop_codon:yes gene_type:complete
MEKSGPNGNAGTYLLGAVNAAETHEQNWPTMTVDDRRKTKGKKRSLNLNAFVLTVGPPAPEKTSRIGKSQGSWPTPDASPRGPRALDLVENQSTVKRRGSGQRRGIDLQTAVGKSQELWGTPTARDWKSGKGKQVRQYKELTPQVERKGTGKLNPNWVEQLQGLEVGWTQLPTEWMQSPTE